MSASDEMSQGPVIRDRRRIDPVTGQPRQAGADSVPGTGQDAAGAQPGGTQASSQQPGGTQPRPGRHAVSKPGSPRPEAAGSGGDAGPAADGGTAGAAGGPAAAGSIQAGETGGAGAADQAGAGSGAEASAGGTAAGRTASGGEDTAGNGGVQAQKAVAELTDKLAERTADLQRLQAEYANYRKRVERDRAAMRELSVASVLGEILPVLDDIGRAREHGELTGGFKSVADSLEAAVTKLGLVAYGQAGETFDPNVHEALMHSYSADVAETTCVQVLQPGYKVGERILRPARVAVAEPAEPPDAPAADATETPAALDATGHGNQAGPDDEQPDPGAPHDSD